MHRNPEFATSIARAREAQQEHEADEIVRLADSAEVDNWQVIKLRIWARQWRASKLAPKKYGDKLELEHSGEMVVMSPEQRQAEIAKLLTKNGAQLRVVGG